MVRIAIVEWVDADVSTTWDPPGRQDSHLRRPCAEPPRRGAPIYERSLGLTVDGKSNAERSRR